MTQIEKVIKPKLGLLELARQLGSVSQACKIMGYGRDGFYHTHHFIHLSPEQFGIEANHRFEST